MKTASSSSKSRTALALALATLTVSVMQAQYSIDWSTLDGGGGTSTGGNYTLSGTIGQPDAGAMSGGNFALEGGFWPGMIVPSTGEPPILFIHGSGDLVIISWSPATAGFELEATDDLTLPAWSSVAGSSPVTNSMSGAARFFRLRKP